MTDEVSPLVVRMKFRSSAMAVRAALAHILVRLQPLGLTAEQLGTVEIVLAEALNNVVEHAYPPQEAQGQIVVECRVDGPALRVQIVDDGRAMPDGTAPEHCAAADHGELPDLPEGGFGWSLIHQLASGIRYRREADRNVLDLDFALGTAA